MKNKYPVPDRSDHKWQQNARRMFYPEIDLGRKEILLSDGRPAVIEDWFDRDCRVDCRTIWYSIIDIEDWNEADHLKFLAENELINEKNAVTTPEKTTDASEQEMWVINWVIKKVED